MVRVVINIHDRQLINYSSYIASLGLLAIGSRTKKWDYPSKSGTIGDYSIRAIFIGINY